MTSLLILLLSCQSGQESAPVPSDSGTTELRGETAPEPTLPEPKLQRLTTTQYQHALRDLFGEGLVLPSSLEPDQRVEGLYSVGATRTAISPYGIEKYEEAAYGVAAQITSAPERRALWWSCEPSGPVDDACAAEILSALGERAWRRPLTETEIETLASVAGHAGETLDDFDAGLEFGIATVLTSPHFLYRAELGDETTAQDGALGSYELASRLSFFLWNTIPDGPLLNAAASGVLLTDDGLASEIDRMLDDPRSRDGLRAFFSEMLHLDELDELNKDPTLFTHMRDTLGPAAREETLLTIESNAFDDRGSYLELFTSRKTFLDRELAALYDVPAPTLDGFAEAWLPADNHRRGLLGQASFLALNAHAVSTSVTLRGIFVREVLLCQDIPAPPADTNTSIPEVDANARTMRERIAVHLEVEACASCHRLTDPIGLGFENYDGIGRWRQQENDVQIDASGELDGTPFQGPATLGRAIGAHPRTPLCLTRTMLQYANGALAEEVDAPLLDWHTMGFAEQGHQLLWLMRDIALGPAFRNHGQVEP